MNTLTLYRLTRPRTRYRFRLVQWCKVHDCQIPGGVNPDERCWFDFRYAVLNQNGTRVQGILKCETIAKWLEL